MPAGKRKREASILFFLGASIIVAALLVIDDVMLYFLVESFFEMRPAFGLRFTVGVIFLILNAGLIWLVYEARKQQAQTGGEGMIGETGKVTHVNGTNVWVQVHGELWRARCATELVPGAGIVVEKMDGLVLQVKPLA